MSRSVVSSKSHCPACFDVAGSYGSCQTRLAQRRQVPGHGPEVPERVGPYSVLSGHVTRSGQKLIGHWAYREPALTANRRSSRPTRALRDGTLEPTTHGSRSF